ncbi:MAG: acetyl-CoA carboxylase biotin carboxyl carrier protein [Bacillaceae bacterium]|nr:acetyl-CoA carboxylase biotin carboxyl carrier protein [Bacillaceae bacterium]
MFKMHEIREIIKLVDQSSISEFEVEGEDGVRLTIKKQGATASLQPVQPVETVAEPSPEAANAPQVEVQQDVSPAPAPKQENVPSEDDAGLHKIVSPMVGTFYKAPEPGADPFVKPGDSVQENTVVCIVEAMKLFNEIEAEVRGEIVEVLVEDGQLVEYGQPLFLVKPA